MLAATRSRSGAQFSLLDQTTGNPYGNQRDLNRRRKARSNSSIANQILQQRSEAGAANRAAKSEARYSVNLVNTVRTSRQKNPELAAELASEIASKLLNEKLLKKPEAAILATDMVRLASRREWFSDRVSRQCRYAGNNRDKSWYASRCCLRQVSRTLQKALSQKHCLSHCHRRQMPTRRKAMRPGILLNGLQQSGGAGHRVAGGMRQSVEKKLAGTQPARCRSRTSSMQNAIDKLRSSRRGARSRSKKRRRRNANSFTSSLPTARQTMATRTRETDHQRACLQSLPAAPGAGEHRAAGDLPARCRRAKLKTH